jgi:hypothetical protein
MESRLASGGASRTSFPARGHEPYGAPSVPASSTSAPAVGISGVCYASHSADEIGIRLALGAKTGELPRMVTLSRPPGRRDLPAKVHGCFIEAVLPPGSYPFDRVVAQPWNDPHSAQWDDISSAPLSFHIGSDSGCIAGAGSLLGAVRSSGRSSPKRSQACSRHNQRWVVAVGHAVTTACSVPPSPCQDEKCFHVTRLPFYSWRLSSRRTAR